MNLTNFLRKDSAIQDHSLVDLTWLEDPMFDFESTKMKKNNNIKPELAVEWGLENGGGELNLNEPAGEVKRNIPDENLGDADSVILFARDMMNRGYRGSQIVASLKKRYPVSLLATAKTGLGKMFALQGIIGRVVLDARGYKNCKAAMGSMANSPYKQFIKYVIGCHCGEPYVLPMNEHGIFGAETVSSGNGFDDFLEGEKTASKNVAHCRSTMLPIMAAQGDLDRSMLDSTLTEMMNLTPIPSGVIEEISASSKTPLNKLAEAFRWIDRQADKQEANRYAGKIDASDFVIQQGDEEIDLQGIPESEMDVDGTNPSLSTDIEYDGFSPITFDGMDSIPNVLDEVPVIDDVSQEQLPVELSDERGGSFGVPIDNLAEVPESQDVDPIQTNLDVDFFTPGEMDVDLDGEQELPINDPVGVLDSLDVDPYQTGMDVKTPESDEIDIDFSESLEPEFQGTDEIELDDSSVLPEELEVDMKREWNP